MSIKHIDRRSSTKLLGEQKPFDRRTEKLSEYFSPERGERKVLRYELLAILTMVEKGKKNMRWQSRLWRWLKGQWGSGPVESNPQPSEGETVLGVPVGGDLSSEGEPEAGRDTE